MEQRLQKALAAAGVASRRKAEEMIAAGRIRVDGVVITAPGSLVDPDSQKIEVDGKPVATKTERYYVALHKPVGYVSTVVDRYAEKKVTDLVQIPGARLVPAGRLDADSEGLLLLSNDGDFIYKVTHPSQSLGKTYLATVEGRPNDDAIKKLSNGLLLPGEDRETAPAMARRVRRGPEPNTTVVELILHEGRNRQVRRMLERVGHPVLRLVRVQVGPVFIGNLEPGAWRQLTPREVRAIQGGEQEKSSRKPARSGQPLPQNKEERGSTKNQRQEESVGNETGDRGSARPRPGQDNGKSVARRVQVHENRVNGRVSPRGEHHAS
jgi:23S rRNA pseudouridine2605 synthase